MAYITEVEQLQIRSALGGVLFSNVKQSPSDFDIILNGGIDEVGEVSGGIRKAMAYYVYARIIREGGTIATRFGAVEKTDEYATRIEQEQKNTIYRECNNIADTYMAEVVNYAKAQGWMSTEGVNPTRRMAYVVGSEEAYVDKVPCKSRSSVSANLVAGDGINIVDGEISVDMGEVQQGTGIPSLAQRVTNAEINIEEVRILATQQEEITVGNGLIKDEKGGISVDFEVVASNAEITNIRTNANEAKTEAEQAKKLAEDVISTLDAIYKIASDAETTAQSAKTEADSAVTTAVDAVGVARESLERANQATESANDALVKANSAQTSATNAENSAKLSAQSASSAKSSAEKAQASAEEVAKGIASIDGKVSESVDKAVEGAFDDVNEALESKAPKVGYAPDLKVDFAKELVGRGVAEPQEIGTIRPTGEISIGDGNATIERVKGKSVVWNQVSNNSRCSPQYNTTSYTITKVGNVFNVSRAELASDTVLYDNLFIHTRIKFDTSNKYLFVGNYSVKKLNEIALYDGVEYFDSRLMTKDFLIFSPSKNTTTTMIRLIHDKLVSVAAESYTLCPVVYNLTQMFGAGNEPTTIEEFEARKPLNIDEYAYNEGEIISYDAKELKSVGFNAFNGSYAKVIGGQQYHALGTITIGFTTELGGETTEVTLDSEGMFTPAETGYVYAEGADICIHLTHTYTPEHTTKYEEGILRLPNIKSIKDKDGNQLFPYGLLSVGSVHDEITATKAVKKIGVVDMGGLEWTYRKEDDFLSNVVHPTPKAVGDTICAKYGNSKSISANIQVDRTARITTTYKVIVKDSSYTDATTFKQAMQGVLLYYELAEPIEVDLPEPLNLTYDAWDFGTEELIAEGATTPLNADVVYQFNAVDRIRENTAKNQALEVELAELKAQLTQLTQVSNDENSNA